MMLCVTVRNGGKSTFVVLAGGEVGGTSEKRSTTERHPFFIWLKIGIITLLDFINLLQITSYPLPPALISLSSPFHPPIGSSCLPSTIPVSPLLSLFLPLSSLLYSPSFLYSLLFSPSLLLTLSAPPALSTPQCSPLLSFSPLPISSLLPSLSPSPLLPLGLSVCEFSTLKTPTSLWRFITT